MSVIDNHTFAHLFNNPYSLFKCIFLKTKINRLFFR